jgi:hypothetical protein
MQMNRVFVQNITLDCNPYRRSATDTKYVTGRRPWPPIVFEQVYCTEETPKRRSTESGAQLLARQMQYGRSKNFVSSTSVYPALLYIIYYQPLSLIRSLGSSADKACHPSAVSLL